MRKIAPHALLELGLYEYPAGRLLIPTKLHSFRQTLESCEYKLKGVPTTGCAMLRLVGLFHTMLGRAAKGFSINGWAYLPPGE